MDKRTNILLTTEDQAIIARLRERSGGTTTSVIRDAIRRHARQEGITMASHTIPTSEEWACMSDLARHEAYGDIELAALAARFHVGSRVWYCSVKIGDTAPASLRHYGRVLAYQSDTGLARVMFDGAGEPEWIDGRLLEAGTEPEPGPEPPAPVRGYRYEQLVVEVEDGEVMVHDSVRNYGGMPGDLAAEVRELTAAGTAYEYYAVTWTTDDRPDAEGGSLVWVPEAGRAGICAGGDSTWDDAESVEDALDRYVAGEWGE